MHLLATALLLFLPCAINAQGLIDVCDPVDFVGQPSDPPLPAVPSQFSATIEGNLVARGQTFVVTEYYDQVGDRGRIEFLRNGTKTVGIFDYTLGEIFLIPDPTPGSDAECRVYEISPSTPGLAMAFGFTQVNGSIHIGSPAAFLERIQGNDTATKYVGEDTVRGIPVQRWQACVNLPNNTYLIDYAFASQDNWTYGMQLDDSVMIPIEFRLNASFVGRRGIDNAYNIYTFVNYASGPDSVPDDVFEVPTGLACLGRLPGQPLPSLPDYFSGRIELNTQFNGSSVLVTLQEYYDYTRGLFRLDFYSQTGPTTLIHDFNQGVQYNISQNTNECEVVPLSDAPRSFAFDFARDTDSEIPQIASPQQLSLLDDFYNYTYEGVTTIRGVQADAWISIRDSQDFGNNVTVTDAVYEVFFSRPGLIVVNEHSVTTVPVILRSKLRGNFTTVVEGMEFSKPFDLEYNFFDVSTEEPPYDAYDVSSCYMYSRGEAVDVVLVMPGSLTGFNVGTLRENIRIAISNFTGVFPLQLVNIRVFSWNDTTIAAHVHIANLTDVAPVPEDQRIYAATALQLIMDGINDGSFTVTIPPNITVTPSIHMHGQNPTSDNDSCPTTPPPSTDTPATAMPSTEPPTNSTLPSTEPPTKSTLPPISTEPPTNSTLPPPTNSTQPLTQAPTTSPTTPPPTCPPDNSGDLQRQLQLKDREIIGIAIGLLFGGMLIGAVLMMLILCICRCVCRSGKIGSYKFKGGASYKKHEDDIALD